MIIKIIMNTDLFYREFGKILKRLRVAAGLTQGELAERIGLSRTSVTNIEVGRQKIPIHFLFILSSTLGVDPVQLLPQKEKLSEQYPETKGFSEVLRDNPDLNNAGQNWLSRVLKPYLTEEHDNEDEKGRKGS